MNHLYETSTGKLISSTSLAIDTIPEGMAVKNIADGSDVDGIWNPQTLSFDPIVRKNVIDYDDFARRVGYSRFKQLKIAARANVDLADFVEFVTSLSTVDLSSADLASALSDIVAAGVWTAEDVAEILNA